MNRPKPSPLTEQAARRQQCLYGTAASWCGAPATVHILADDAPTMSCPTHVEYWAEHGYTDLHPIGATCGTPRVFWMWSKPDEPGRCVPGSETS